MADQRYFDEIIGPDGQIRQHYAGVYGIWESLPAEKRRLLHRRSIQLFAGDYAQDSLPRVLTQEELRLLRCGVGQRARAILAFLHDYCIKGRRWRRIMPEATLRDIISRHHRRNVLRDVRPESLAFPYGPDVIRDRQGCWRVVEDSAGIIGGVGDLVQSQKVLYRLVPGYCGELADANDPLDFFSELANHFSEKARQNKGIPLLYLQDYVDEPDQETRRLAQVFSSLGIETTTSTHRSKKLLIEQGGIFLQARKKKRRVGALILHAGPEQMDGRMFRIQIKGLRSLRKGAYKGEMIRLFARTLTATSLTQALLEGHAWTNFSPGIQFVNDKVFGLFVDEMIRQFLKEELILMAIPARSMAVWSRSGRWLIDRSVRLNLRRDRGRYVIKRVDEDGGRGVWIGQKKSKRSLDQIISKIQNVPEQFIIQEFEHPSVLEDRIVDLRLHAHVDQEKIIVSNNPWGRANWIDGNGKVNIGSKGFLSPVLVVPDKT